MEFDIKEIAKKAHEAYFKTQTFDNEIKNSALRAIADKLNQNKELIFEANKKDLIEAKTLLQNNEITKSSYDRLKLDEAKFRDLIKGIEDLIRLDDPVNKVLLKRELAPDLTLEKVSTPIGVIGVIFEARPDCFIQIASLIIKSGNCALLKGGREALNTNTIFSKITTNALLSVNYPQNTINLVYSREDIKKMLDMDEYLSLIIPRGSNSLVKYIKENTKIPVLGHSSGICHIYIDKESKFQNALDVVLDAKTQYPSACNSIETLLVHKDFSDIDKLKQSLSENGVKIEENPEKWDIEWGDKILSFKIVNSLNDAIEHINKYGSGHTDAIISDNKENIDKFMKYVDSAGVFANCSTRFADGFRYGFGAEVGISTNKTHARGPVGLFGLTIYKYKLKGNYDTVSPFISGKKTFTHKDLEY